MPDPTAAGPAVVRTIGHSTRSFDELVELLRSAGVRRVVDIRTVPRSRHNPQFDRATLPGALAREGLDYRHAPALGGLRRPARDSSNTGWRNASFRGFADYMQTPTFERAIRDLVTEARSTPLALLCAEAVPWRCHRSLVADALLARGVSVLHILGAGSPSPHVRTPFAVVEGEQVRYPPVEVSDHPLESFGDARPPDAPPRASSSGAVRRRRPPAGAAGTE